MTDPRDAPQLPQVEPAARPPSAGPPTFRAIFDAELPYVWNVLRRLGARPDDLEDLAHEVFVAVHRGLAAYDPARPLRPWLFGIAFRVVSNHCRKAHRRYEIAEDAAGIADEADGPEAQLVASQDRRLVLAALDALDLDFRTVLVMHDLEGHAIPEVASTLGIPLNTAYSRLRLAREQFGATVRRIQLRRGER